MAARLITCDFYEPGDDRPDAEAVYVVRRGEEIELRLHNGSRLVFGRDELFDGLGARPRVSIVDRGEVA